MKTFWKPVPTITLAIWILAAIAFWISAIADDKRFLLLDYVNLPFHEFGHLFFGILGKNIGIWGGTIMQLAIPLGIFLSFWSRKETLGVAFSSFWFGENMLNISVYVADARKMELPLVGGGEHDWNIILSRLNMLQYDTLIAGIVRSVGWLIMLSSIVWLIIIGIKTRTQESE
jgi:hypothetical protein